MFETGGNTHILTTVLTRASGSINVVTMDFNPWLNEKNKQSSSGTAHVDLWSVLRFDMDRSDGTQNFDLSFTQD